MRIGKTFVFVKIIRLFGILVTVAIFSNCKNNKTADPFVATNFNSFDQEVGRRIETYNHVVSSNHSTEKSGNPSLYIDFSSGINKAFTDPAIQGMMTDCFNTILAQKFDVYKLGSNKLTAMNVANTTELGQQVSDPSQYADIFAPIQKAAEKIVEGNNDALLITDFEEWQKDKEVTNTAFLKIPFSKWLEKGNSIHFFIADYKEGVVDKHIYFTVFSCGNPDASSMISKLQTKLGPLTTRFDLSNNNFELSTEYPSKKTGGIFYDLNAKSDKAKNVLDLKDTYLDGLKNGNYFEFYPLGIDWENISKLHNSYSSQNQFNDFFRKLIIDLSNEDSYMSGAFETKVSDITADFENFSKAEEAKKHKPILVKGNNGEAKFADAGNDAIALACYDTNGNLKEQWGYKSQPAIPINDVFVLNKLLFANTLSSNKKHVELGVSFDPKFNIKNIKNPEGLIKVDILLSTATPNLSGVKMSKFQWLNAKKVPNTALAESIKNTLQELKPNNKIVYSYYIKAKQ